MKVRITKASKPTYWYANKIGKIYRVVVCACPDDYLVKIPKRRYSSMYIKSADCEVLDERD